MTADQRLATVIDDRRRRRQLASLFRYRRSPIAYRLSLMPTKISVTPSILSSSVRYGTMRIR